ncbi:MAG: class I SAM-dependent methyltransferase [Gemmatimonadaceae bacterium]
MSKRAAPGDHFSSIAASYATFRPKYPPSLFERLSALVQRRGLAWDCAAGTGQATLDLAGWFDRVIGSDVSSAQIAQAFLNPKITWQVAPAESSGIAGGTVDLIAVPQALHWFDLERFYREAKRVAVDGGILAAWSYGSAELAGEVGDAYRHFEHETMRPYWPAERRYVTDVYKTIDFPFEELDFPAMTLDAIWTRDQLLGYMRTWSATTRYVARHDADPVLGFAKEIQLLWPDPEQRRALTWPLTTRVGRISKH